jgi:hypothetical protein
VDGMCQSVPAAGAHGQHHVLLIIDVESHACGIPGSLVSYLSSVFSRQSAHLYDYR